MTEAVLCERRDNIASVTLNREKAFNAMNLDLLTGLMECLMELSVDENVRVVILKGKGAAFSAGGDLKWMSTWPQGAPAAIHRLAAALHAGIVEIRRMPKPVIAAVGGVAAGAGFALALACDFRVLSHSAVFREAYTSVGLSMDGGFSFFLPRMVGLAKALEIMAFDRPIPAREAAFLGLGTKLVPDENLDTAAEEMARDLCGRAGHAIGQAKALLNESFITHLETQLERERESMVACAAHPEGREGMAAFAEKRKPVFFTPRS